MIPAENFIAAVLFKPWILVACHSRRPWTFVGSYTTAGEAVDVARATILHALLTQTQEHCEGFAVCVRPRGHFTLAQLVTLPGILE